MINLLPEFEKRKRLKEYRLRASVIILCSVFFLEILAAVLLAPSYYLIDTAKNALTRELAAKKEVTASATEDPQKKSTLIMSEILLLNPPLRSSDIPPSQILSEILAHKPQGISVSSFAYGRAGTGASAQLSGVSETREDLLAFQRMLKDNQRFGDIKYAQSFITKKTDIDFQLTVTIK